MHVLNNGLTNSEYKEYIEMVGSVTPEVQGRQPDVVIQPRQTL